MILYTIVESATQALKPIDGNNVFFMKKSDADKALETLADPAYEVLMVDMNVEQRP